MDRGTLKSPRREGTGVSQANPLGLKYVYRIEADWRSGPRETIGWRVKFPDCHTLTSRSKSFYDYRYGSKKQSLMKAIEWRDAMMKKYRIPMTHRRLPVPWVRQSDTGVRGVYRHKSKRLYVSFIAEDSNRYTRIHFGFGPGVRTEREAIVAAVKHRIAQERRLYGHVVSKIPGWIKKSIAADPSPPVIVRRVTGKKAAEKVAPKIAPKQAATKKVATKAVTKAATKKVVAKKAAPKIVKRATKKVAGRPKRKAA
jgi:hypothetical protein